MLCLRRAWLAAMIPVIVVGVATSCDDDPTPSPPSPDSGAQPGQLGESVCPDAAPEAGEGCVVPEGTTCSFGACSAARIAQCSRGTWKFGGNVQPPPLCPLEIPASETACPDCFPASLECRYGTCDLPDATARVTSASCDAGRWAIAIVQTCAFPDAGLVDAAADGAADGASDAGADVQVDADAGVD